MTPLGQRRPATACLVVAIEYAGTTVGVDLYGGVTDVFRGLGQRGRHQGHYPGKTATDGSGFAQDFDRIGTASAWRTGTPCPSQAPGWVPGAPDMAADTEGFPVCARPGRVYARGPVRFQCPERGPRTRLHCGQPPTTLGLPSLHWQSASTSFNGNATTLPITQVQQGLAGPLPGTDIDYILAPLVVSQPTKAKDNMQCTDPATGGVWCLRIDGSIWSYPVDGGSTPPWLGGLNTSVGQGVNVANISGITPNTSAPGPGYTISVDNGVAGFAIYAFTRDGKFAHL